MIATMPKPYAVLQLKFAQRRREAMREKVIDLQREVTCHEKCFQAQELDDLRTALTRVRSILSRQL